MPVCEFCEKVFTRKDNLGKHYMEIHKLNRENFPQSFFAEKDTKRENQVCKFCSVSAMKMSRHLLVCKSKPKDSATGSEPQKREPVIPASPRRSSQIKISESSEISRELRSWMVEKHLDRGTINWYMNLLGDQLKMIGQRRLTAIALNNAFENFCQFAETQHTVSARKKALQACILAKNFCKRFQIDLIEVRVPTAERVIEKYFKSPERGVAYANLDQTNFHESLMSGSWGPQRIENFLKLELLLLFKSEDFVKQVSVAQMRNLVGTARQILFQNRRIQLSMKLFKILLLFINEVRPLLMGESHDSCIRLFSSHRNMDQVTIGSDVFALLENVGKSPFYIRRDHICNGRFSFVDEPVTVHPYDFEQEIPEQEAENLEAGVSADDPQVPDPPTLPSEVEEPSGPSAGTRPKKGKGKGKISGLTEEDIVFLMEKFRDVRRNDLEMTDVLYRLITAEENDSHLDNWVEKKLKDGGFENVDDLAKIVFRMLQNNLK